MNPRQTVQVLTLISAAAEEWARDGLLPHTFNDKLLSVVRRGKEMGNEDFIVELRRLQEETRQKYLAWEHGILLLETAGICARAGEYTKVQRVLDTLALYGDLYGDDRWSALNQVMERLLGGECVAS